MTINHVAAPTSAAPAPESGVSRERVRLVVIAVPGVALSAGAAASAADPRAGLLASAVVLGWTQLVGL